ncbi:MAG: preprotein translocase subunit SecE [Planctomycetes bacterium]|nr:preprotein translocase subunit SecE [Planctomycetota bacterium]
MGKEKSVQAGVLHEIFQVGVYKRSQGRIARQVTFAVLGATIALAAYSLWSFMSATRFSRDFLGMNVEAVVDVAQLRWLLPAVLLLAGIWIAYRVVNLPRFADFLIAVEAEMNKVSWPSRTELFRSSMVVIIVIFVLAFLLFGYDIVWQSFFRAIGVLK